MDINFLEISVILGAYLLGAIPFDYNLEDAIGDPEKIIKSDFGKNLENIITHIF